MPAPQRYDYSEALQQLQARIEQISDWQAQQRPAPSALRPLVQLWRNHKSSIIALGTLYSISTASVISVFIAERQLQADKAPITTHTQQLTREITRLQAEAAAAQATLQQVQQAVQQQPHGWWANGLRQQVRDILATCQVLGGSAPPDVELAAPAAAAAAGRSAALHAREQQGKGGLRVGPAGPGFVI